PALCPSLGSRVQVGIPPGSFPASCLRIPPMYGASCACVRPPQMSFCTFSTLNGSAIAGALVVSVGCDELDCEVGSPDTTPDEQPPTARRRPATQAAALNRGDDTCHPFKVLSCSACR